MTDTHYTHTLPHSEVASGHGKGLVETGRRVLKGSFTGTLAAFWNSPDVAAVAAVRTLIQYQRRARDRARLAQMETYLLEDMGMTRTQADIEAAKPFWQA